MQEKIKIGFIGYGYAGSVWGEYLISSHGYERGKNLFCYDPPKGMFDYLEEAEIVVICVPTPADQDGKCDLNLVHESIQRTKPNQWIVIRSTVPPMTTARLSKKYPNRRGFCFIPEFLTETRAMEDFRNPDRVIIAPANRECQIVDTLLSLLPRARAVSVPGYPDDAYRRLDATSTEAELVKYFGNLMGAMKVHLAEMFQTAAQLCEFILREEGVEQRVDWNGHIRRMAAADYRIGPAHLISGHDGYRGFGGYCFIKDTYALYSFFNELWSFAATSSLIPHNSSTTNLLILLDHNRRFLEHMLAGNAALLELQGLTEEEAMSHTVVLKEILGKKKLHDVSDYLVTIKSEKETK